MNLQSVTDVKRRSRGYCEAQVDGVCEGRATQVHHKKLRSRGGSDDPRNLLHVCGFGGTGGCHGWIHSNVAKATELGFMTPSWADEGSLD